MSLKEEDDDLPQLSAESFLALQEFYKEKEKSEQHFKIDTNNLTFDENWQLSQFWYDEKTSMTLARIAIEAAGVGGKIALISCPTLYKVIKKGLSESGEVTLFEYDTRFATFGEDFIPYDYKFPLEVPREKASYYDVVVADPPFLSEECLTKTSVTIKFLTKSKIMLCTGSVMEELAQRLLSVQKTRINPQHKNNLGNQFCCYSNFQIGDIL